MGRVRSYLTEPVTVRSYLRTCAELDEYTRRAGGSRWSLRGLVDSAIPAREVADRLAFDTAIEVSQAPAVVDGRGLTCLWVARNAPDRLPPREIRDEVFHQIQRARVYQRELEPVPAYQQRYEAENASLFRATTVSGSAASNGYSVGGIANSGDKRTNSYVDFIVNVPTARAYTMTVRYANGGGAATQGLAVNGGAYSTVSYPATSGQFGSVTTTVNLTAGFNTIRLAKGAPRFAGGTGTVQLDYIELM